MEQVVPWVYPVTFAALSIVFMLNTEFSSGLLCWHCIAENCAEDPADNYKATKKECTDGQICQKVYFEMYSNLEQKRYESTVRGCSSNCVQRDDFSNCSTLLRESRGCIKKTCCWDSDLCNHAEQTVSYKQLVLPLLLCLGIVVGIFQYH